MDEDQQMQEAENKKIYEESFIERQRLKEYNSKNYLICTLRFSMLEKVLTKFVINYQLENDFELSEDIVEIEKQFYRRVCKELGEYEFILNSISKIVIKDKFILSGLTWIKIILGKSDFNNVEKGTIDNLEYFVKKYVNFNSKNIREDIKIQQDLSLVLDFLIKKGSNDAFRLNEWIASLK